MNYEDYTLTDFLKDDYFLKWIKNPDSETDHFWESWIMNNPHKQRTINKARSIVEGIVYENQFVLEAKDYTNTLEQIVRFNTKTNQLTERPKNSSLTKIWWSIAATLLLLAIPLVLLLLKNDNVEQLPRVSYIEKKAPVGAKITLKLPDGTMVKLNSESSIQYPENFQNDTRTVLLSGEAFFDVVKDENKPFKVVTDNFNINVLGTSFNVRAFKEENTIKVAVVTGLVKVGKPEGVSLLIEPSSMAIFTKKSNELEKIQFDPMTELSWKDNILYFENETLSEVFKTLQKWYGVTIHVSPDIDLTEPYSGKYMNESLDNVLLGISYTSNIQFEINDSQIKVVKK